MSSSEPRSLRLDKDIQELKTSSLVQLQSSPIQPSSFPSPRTLDLTRKAIKSGSQPFNSSPQRPYSPNIPCPDTASKHSIDISFVEFKRKLGLEADSELRKAKREELKALITIKDEMVGVNDLCRILGSSHGCYL
jgi:hypothetical protein